MCREVFYLGGVPPPRITAWDYKINVNKNIFAEQWLDLCSQSAQISFGVWFCRDVETNRFHSLPQFPLQPLPSNRTPRRETAETVLVSAVSSMTTASQHKSTKGNYGNCSFRNFLCDHCPPSRTQRREIAKHMQFPQLPL